MHSFGGVMRGFGIVVYSFGVEKHSFGGVEDNIGGLLHEFGEGNCDKTGPGLKMKWTAEERFWRRKLQTQ